MIASTVLNCANYDCSALIGSARMVPADPQENHRAVRNDTHIYKLAGRQSQSFQSLLAKRISYDTASPNDPSCSHSAPGRLGLMHGMSTSCALLTARSPVFRCGTLLIAANRLIGSPMTHFPAVLWKCNRSTRVPGREHPGL